MYATNYFEDMMLNVLRGVEITAIPKVYLALLTTDPGDEGVATEVSYSGYSRQEINFSDPASDSTGLETHNVELIQFAEFPSNNVTVSHVGVMTDSQGGNMLLYGQLNPPLILQNGITPIFRIGAIKWIWSGNFGDYYRRAFMNVLRGSGVSGILQPYIALCNGDPQQIDNAEFNGSNYDRIPLDVTVPVQQSNGSDLCYNANEIISNESLGNWGTLNTIAIYDASRNGNVYAVLALGSNFTVTAHTAVGFHVGALRVTVN